MNEEVWKDIQGYEGLYQVSSLGRVKALAKTIIYKDGRVYPYKEKILKFSVGTSGYPTLHFYSLEGVRETCMIHRLVAKSFIPNPETKITINHIDGNKTNNQVENLEWNTYAENKSHALATGLTKVTASKLESKLAKLDKEAVIDILTNCKKRVEGVLQKDFAAKYNVSSTCIESVFKRFSLEEFECQDKLLPPQADLKPSS